MRDLKPGMQTRNVRRWQKFLNCHPDEQNPHLITSLSLSGYFGKATETATKAFQKAHSLTETGELDEATRRKAFEQGFKLEFEISPLTKKGEAPDLRELRPYFLVPLLGDDLPKHPANKSSEMEIKEECDPQEKNLMDSQSHFQDSYQQINQWINETNAVTSCKVTDIFVFSHGWHRNFYGAVQAYDRMTSLIVRMRHRKILKLPADQYRPLFLMLHWNSDPGEDEWEDRSGRRTRTSFMDNVLKNFEIDSDVPYVSSIEPNRASPKTYVEFLNDFENMHHLFAQTSAPDVAALHDPALQENAMEYTKSLEFYRIKAAPGADLAEKVAVAWTCYHEATASQILLDQTPIKDRFMQLQDAIYGTLKFFTAIFGLFTVLGLAYSIFKSSGNFWLARLWQWFIELPPVASLHSSLGGFGLGLAVYITMAILAIPSCAVLKWQAAERQKEILNGNTSGSGVPLLSFVCWLCLQLVCSVPVFFVLLSSFIFGRLTAWSLMRSDSSVKGLFDERFGKRDVEVTSAPKKRYPRDVFGDWVAFPTDLLLQAVHQDSGLARLGEGLRAQIAFFRMQRRGVQAGQDAAHFLAGLFAPPPDLLELSSLSNARIHLIGHSFGGLVVSNTVRTLAVDPDQRALFRKSDPNRRIFSVTLLQAAMANSWFQCEEQTRLFIKSTLACIYSAYDTANGFIYPVANNGRMTAGYTGLHHVGGEIGSEGYEPETRARFISLPHPPELDEEQYKPHYEKTPPAPAALGGPKLLNLDASRLIYQGRPASGGGHGDVFKESVINLIWAAISRGAVPIEGSTEMLPSPTSTAQTTPLALPDDVNPAEAVVEETLSEEMKRHA